MSKGKSSKAVLPSKLLDLPLKPVERIIKLALPENTRLAKDAQSAFAKVASIFSLYLSHTASEICKKHKRSTINANDILEAVEEMEFSELVPPLQANLEAIRSNRKPESATKKQKKSDSHTNGQGNTNSDSKVTVTTDPEAAHSDDDAPQPQQPQGPEVDADEMVEPDHDVLVEDAPQDEEVYHDDVDDDAAQRSSSSAKSTSASVSVASSSRFQTAASHKRPLPDVDADPNEEIRDQDADVLDAEEIVADEFEENDEQTHINPSSSLSKRSRSASPQQPLE